ncbi:MAG: bifunctional diguanylate cyclase/phosphodiesterase [Mycobacterium sp.]
MPKFTWGASSVAAIVAVAGCLLLDFDQMTARGFGDLVILVMSGIAMLCTMSVVSVTRGRQRSAWTWQSIGLAGWFASEAVEFYYTGLSGLERSPFPSVSDVAYLVYPIAACLALVRFPPNNFRFRARVVLDGVIVSIASFEVIWQTVLKHAYHLGAPDPIRFAVTVAYPVTDVLIVAVAAMVLTRLRGTQRTVVVLLAVGAVFNAVADSANVYSYAFDAYVGITVLIYVGWAGAVVFMTAAALLARRARAVEDPDEEMISTRLDVWLPYSALALAALVCGLQYIPSLSHGPLLTTSVLLLLAAVVRHAIVLLDNRRLHGVVSDQALRDPLTGLANRALFRDRTAHAIHLRQRDNRAVAIVLLDLDDFRRVNSEFGQALGDELLVMVANRLMNAVRAGDTVARIGADEFAVVMEGAADQARIIAHRVVRAFDEPFSLGSRSIAVRPSVGFAMAASDTDDVSATELLEQVDLAMQQAKRVGGRGLHTFTEDMRSAVRNGAGRDSDEDAVLLRDLRRAIDDVELSVVYQPKVDLRTGKPVGVEALVRWPHREHGLLAPDSFLPLVRQHGLMSGVTELVLNRALDDVVTWQAGGLRVPVSVNLSAPSVADTNLPAYISRELASRHLEPSILTVEITEDLLLENTQRARSVLDRLRASGTRVALDDFGSGYSALWYLRDLSFDEVKLDRQFITPLLTDRRAAVIVRTVIDLAHDLGGTVVAEGVENAATSERLRDYGCETAQGFYYSPPLPAQEAFAFFKASGMTAPTAVKPS